MLRALIHPTLAPRLPPSGPVLTRSRKSNPTGTTTRPRLPSPRTYESLRATFRRPQELVTTETVDIAAAAAAAAAEAEAEEQGGGVLEQGAGAFKGVGTEGLGVNDDAGSGGSNGSGMVEGVIGGPLGDAQAGGIASGGYAKETSGDAGRKGAAGGGVREEKILEVEKNQGSDEVEREKGKEMVEDDDDAEEGKEFVPDPYMRRGETACRKLQVEGVTPLIRASRASPATCEALAGEETEEVRGAGVVSYIICTMSLLIGSNTFMARWWLTCGIIAQGVTTVCMCVSSLNCALRRNLALSCYSFYATHIGRCGCGWVDVINILCLGVALSW